MKTKIEFLRIFSLVIAAVLISACSSKNYLPLETVDNVDVSRYLGKWYEVAKLPNAELNELVRNPSVHAAIRLGLSRLASGGSSTRVARAILLDTPPTMAKGEITDKGYINQRAVLTNRSEWVEMLYGTRKIPEIIYLQEKE